MSKTSKRKHEIETELREHEKEVQNIMDKIEIEKLTDMAKLEQKRKEDSEAIAHLKQQMNTELTHLNAKSIAAAEALEDALHKEVNRLQVEQRKKEFIVNNQIKQKETDIKKIATIAEHTAEEKYDCIICFESVRLIYGYRCLNQEKEKHFTCDECLVGHITAAMQEDLGILEAKEGKVYCPGINCKAPNLDDEVVMYHAASAWTVYAESKNKLMEHQLSKKIREEERRRLEEEQARLAKLNAEEKELLKHHTHITENLLTLACPRCKAAFVDFEGCFALQCSQCPCGFCAMCLKDCGTDAHGHVANCQEGQAGLHNGVFGDKRQFEDIQKRRKGRLVREYLNNVPHGMQQRLAQRCEKDFQDLGLQNIVKEFGGHIIERRRGGGGVAIPYHVVNNDALLAEELQQRLWDGDNDEYD